MNNAKPDARPESAEARETAFHPMSRFSWPRAPLPSVAWGKGAPLPSIAFRKFVAPPLDERAAQHLTGGAAILRASDL